MFFEISNSKSNNSANFVLRGSGEVPIDQKFYLVLPHGLNSIPQKWDLIRVVYRNIVLLSRSVDEQQPKFKIETLRLGAFFVKNYCITQFFASTPKNCIHLAI